MADCSALPTVESTELFKQDAGTINEVVTSPNSYTENASDGKPKKTLSGLAADAAAAIQGVGFINKGEFSTLPTIENVNEVAVFEGNFWLPTEPLPYTATGSSPLLPPEADKWVVAVTAELLGIARSLNCLNSQVIYSTDTATVLDGVLYIYDAGAQVVWIVPTLAGVGESIVSVAGDVLTTNVSAYTLEMVRAGVHVTNYSFSTTSDLVSANYLQSGDTATVDDRGGARFKVSSSLTHDGYGIIELSNGLFAEIVIVGNRINAEWLGVIDGTNDGGIVEATSNLASSLGFDYFIPKKDTKLLLDRTISVTAPITVDLCNNEIECTDLTSAIKYSAIFEFKGSLDTSIQALAAADFSVSTTRLTLTSNPFSVGDYVAAMYDTSAESGYELFERIVFLARVNGVDGNTVTLDYDAKFDLLQDGAGYTRPITGNLTLVKASPLQGGELKGASFNSQVAGARIALSSHLLAYNGAVRDSFVDGIVGHLSYFAACRNTFAYDCTASNPSEPTGGQGYTVQSFGSKNVGMIRCRGDKVRHHWDSSFFTVDAICRDCESYDAQGNYDYGCHSQYVSGLLLDNCTANGDVQSGANETGVLWGNDDTVFGGVTDRLRIIGGSYTGRSARVYAFPVNFDDCSVSFIDFKFAQTSNIISFQVRTHSNSKVTFTNPDIDGFKIGFGNGTYTESITFHGGKVTLDPQGWAGTGSASVEFFGTNVTGVPTSGVRGFKMSGGYLEMGAQQNPVCEVFVLDGTVVNGDITWAGVDSNSKLMFDDVRWTKSGGALRLRNNSEIKGIKYTAVSGAPTIYVEESFLDSASINISGVERFSVDGAVGVGGIYQLHNNVRLINVTGYNLTLTDRVQMISTNVASGYTGTNTTGAKSVFTDNLSYA